MFEFESDLCFFVVVVIVVGATPCNDQGLFLALLRNHWDAGD